MKRIVLALLLLVSLFFLLGCTETDIPTIPYNTAQLIAKSTDLNYTLFTAGFYDENCLAIDANKLTVSDCNGAAASTDWADLTGFPAPCPAGYAVQIIDASLGCIAVGGGGGFLEVFDDSNLDAAGVLLFPNPASSQAVSVRVFDDSNFEIYPDTLQALDDGNISIGLHSFEPLSGEWYVTIVGGSSSGTSDSNFVDTNIWTEGYNIDDLLLDTNWETSWTTFDANMVGQYRRYSVDLNTSENINADKNINAGSYVNIGANGYIFDDGTQLIIGRRA